MKHRWLDKTDQHNRHASAGTNHFCQTPYVMGFAPLIAAVHQELLMTSPWEVLKWNSGKYALLHTHTPPGRLAKCFAYLYDSKRD